jgi:DNA processing protein
MGYLLRNNAKIRGKTREIKALKRTCHDEQMCSIFLTMETCWDGGDLPPEELRRMLSLALAPGVGPATYHKLLGAFGSAEGVFGASVAELTAVCPQLKPEALEAIQAGPNLRAVRFQEETCARLKVRIVSERSAAYPAPLRTLPHPPPFLFVAGAWRPEDGKALAVVGTRFPSAYGTRMARELTTGLGESGFVIVSGLARGIDTLSHEAALAAGARTVAVLGSGLDWIYPPENVKLARNIAKQGCLITEFPMGMAPHATHFPRRNRLISALSLGTLVVEAGNDSGALITADYALDQGREVFAVPGAVHQPGCQGTHKLIQEGAHLVERAADIVALLQGTTAAVPARRFALAATPALAVLVGASGSSGSSGPGHRSASGEAFSETVGASPGAETACLGIPLELEFETPSATMPSTPAETAEPPPPETEGWGPHPILTDAGRDALTALFNTSLSALKSGHGAAAATALESAAAGLDEEARSLLSLIGREAVTLDAIAEKARRKPRFRNAAPHRLLAGLLELELKGRVKRMPGALFRLS